uniref:Olfactory receptor n=1 Tax=Gopherus evgoodei TaxID=1825980 RepID=A0A8C4YTQ9_9SAUR
INQISITEFILLGFGNLHELQIPLFLLFLVIYIVTMAGNILIIALVVADQHLHTPMYFFLGNLSCLETCYSSTILPRMLAGLLTGDRTISFMDGCITQLYFFVFMVTAECFLLLVVSYDRYLAICNPLHYAALMRSWVCIQLVSGSWTMAFFTSTLITLLMARLTFCGPNNIDHFFCDFAPMLKLSCRDTSLIELVNLILCFAIILPTFLLTLICYVCIIATILRIPSTTERHKAFSTCSSHLIVVATFYGSIIISYMIPTAGTAGDLHKVFSVFYTVLTPLVNPLIYSLRNKEVKEALRKQSLGCLSV